VPKVKLTACRERSLPPATALKFTGVKSAHGKVTADRSEGDSMERSSKSGQAAGSSFLSSDLKIEGDIVSEGDLHISGSVTGDVVARRLTLDQGASITGSVKADVAVIGGNLAGRLAATSVTLGSTAEIAADVTHVSLVIEEGAVFQGQSRRVETLDALAGDKLRPRRLEAPARAEAGND